MFGARRVGRRALVAALLGSTCAGLAVPHAAQAQASRQASFSVPAGPLTSVLATFGRQSGLQVTYLPDIASGKSSAGASGSLSAGDALSRILQGSGLTYSFTGGDTVTILDPAGAPPSRVDADGSLVLDVIDVTGGSGVSPADAPFETAGSSNYISREQIQRFGVTSPGDIFKGTPGVIAAGSHNGAKLDVNIRGLQGQGRVKVAIDGTQQSSTTWRGYLGVDERVYIDPDLIGGVGIEKGPTGDAAGAGTTGGVVAIRTLNAGDIVQEGKEFGIRLRGGVSDNAIAPIQPYTYDQRTDAPTFWDFDNGSGSAALAISKENYDFVIAAAKRKTGNYFAGTEGAPSTPISFTKPGEEVFNTSEDTVSGLAKGTLRWGEGHSLELGYVHFDSEFGESMGSLLFQQDNGFRQVKLSDITTDTYTAKYRWNPGDDLYDLRLNIWASDVAGTTRAVAAAPDFSQWGYIPADEPRFSETWTYGVDATNTSRFDTDYGALRFDYGASYQLEDLDGEEYCSRTYTNSACVWMQPSVGTREIGSVFSTGMWEINEWLKLDGSLRYDAYRQEDESYKAVPGADKKDGGRLSPTIALTVTPVEGVQLFTRYAEGMRPPTMRETMISDANTVPNIDLQPEIARNWEAGVNVLRDSLFMAGDKARFKLAYFHNDTENYISRIDNPNGGPGLPVFAFANLDSAMFSGFELSGEYEAGMFFSSLGLNYYTDFEFCQHGVCSDGTVGSDYAVAHVPPKVSVSLTLGARLLEDRLMFGTRITHNGERLAPVPDGADRQRTPFWLPYTTVDAFASYQVNDNLKMDVQAENIFDRYYIDALDGWTPAPGRTIRANLTATF
jgi:hemoglobin/transferrin/lactoferrin receptor protein